MMRRSLAAAHGAAAIATSASVTVPSTSTTPSPFNANNPSASCSAATPRTSHAAVGSEIAVEAETAASDSAEPPSVCAVADCRCPPSAPCGCSQRRAKAAAASMKQRASWWWPLRGWLLPLEADEAPGAAQGTESGSRLFHELGSCHCGCARTQVAAGLGTDAGSSAGAAGSPAVGAAAALAAKAGGLTPAAVAPAAEMLEESADVPDVAAHIM